MPERVDTSPAESIPPTVLMDRMMERNDRTMKEGFAMLREEMAMSRQEVAASRRWVTSLILVAMVLLGARDFGRFFLETAFMRIETSSPTTTSTVGSVP